MPIISYFLNEFILLIISYKLFFLLNVVLFSIFDFFVVLCIMRKLESVKMCSEYSWPSFVYVFINGPHYTDTKSFDKLFRKFKFG